MSPVIVKKMPRPGDKVRLRQRTWLVEGLIISEGHEANPIVQLACYDDDAEGETLSVLWGVERNPEIIDEEAWQDIGKKGFDDPRQFSAFIHTLRWNCVTATDPKLFQAPFRAGIRMDAYQLEPLEKALQMPRVNLFIADDVGLGKTIEAGLIASELLLRRRVKEIVVAAPPNMLIQWQEEMDERFGLHFEILDRQYLEKIRQERGYAVNPWTTFPRFLVSHKLLIDETYMAPFRDWLGAIKTNSLLILDESHHAAPASGIRYAIDSKFTRAVRDLAPRFEHRLFLSATPHNGHSNSFSALLEILDPIRFTRGVPVIKKHVEDAIIRRLKDDIREVLGGGFPKRETPQIDLSGLPEDQSELVLGRMLDEYRSLRMKKLEGASKRQQTEFGLLFSGLQQRLLSSVSAFSKTLSIHKRTMERIWAKETEAQSNLRFDHSALRGSFDADDDRAELPDDEKSGLEEEAMVSASLSTAVAGEAADIRERELLSRMEAIARDSRDIPDARVKWLYSWIDTNMRSGGSWNDLRIIIFTEYEDTRRYLMHSLNERYPSGEGARRIEFYSGITSAYERERIKRDFNSDPHKTPLRILVATDAAREGLNLQAQCWNLFHFDVPWNPGRLDQRNGRIDRKLQPNPTVYCHYFVYTQRPEDKVLQVLVRKSETIHKQLGSLSQILEARLADTLKQGIRRDSVDRLAKSIEDAEVDPAAQTACQDDLEEVRLRHDKLEVSIKALSNRLEAARKWIGLDERHLRDSLDCSLEIMGMKGLESAGKTGSISRFTFPDLSRRRGADPSWAVTLAALKPRATNGDRPASDAPLELLPVVFEAPETQDDNVIQLHLEHKLVKRLLGRFLSQGFLHHDLSRACLVQSEDSIPRVALLGRLSVYGKGAVRLHEELIAVAARWIEPNKRGGESLKPYGSESEDKTLGQLEEALVPGRKIEPDSAMRELCLEGMVMDIKDLLPILERKSLDSLARAKSMLTLRGEKEADSMKSLLEEQRKRVEKTRREEDTMAQQLQLFNEEEKRQYQSNRKYWDKWLTDAELKLSAEPERIRQFYTTASFRIEPVGIVYLMPAKD
jgi:superfamily II DNA or RNA helicase